MFVILLLLFILLALAYYYIRKPTQTMTTTEDKIIGRLALPLGDSFAGQTHWFGNTEQKERLVVYLQGNAMNPSEGPPTRMQELPGVAVVTFGYHDTLNGSRDDLARRVLDVTRGYRNVFVWARSIGSVMAPAVAAELARTAQLAGVIYCTPLRDLESLIKTPGLLEDYPAGREMGIAGEDALEDTAPRGVLLAVHDRVTPAAQVDEWLRQTNRAIDCVWHAPRSGHNDISAAAEWFDALEWMNGILQDV